MIDFKTENKSSSFLQEIPDPLTIKGTIEKAVDRLYLLESLLDYLDHQNIHEKGYSLRKELKIHQNYYKF